MFYYNMVSYSNGVSFEPVDGKRSIKKLMLSETRKPTKLDMWSGRGSCYLYSRNLFSKLLIL